MPADLVGAIVGQADPGQGGATAPISGSGPAPKPGQAPHQNAEQRIQQLVAERNEAKRRFQSAEQRMVDLESRFATLEGHVNQQPQSTVERGPPNSWADLNDTELQKSYVEAGESSNWQGQLAIQRELTRRATEKATNASTQTTENLLQRQRNYQEVSARIQSEFGQKAKQGDPLYERADGYATMLTKKYGNDFLQKFPDVIFLSFAAADRDLAIPERQELQELRVQNERFKAQQSIEPGAVRGAATNAEVAEALKRGDVKSAIDNLGIVKRMAARR